MVQENTSPRALEIESRVEQMERQVAQRLSNIDSGIEQAFGQVREGDFVRKILRGEIQRVIQEEQAEREGRAERERMERLEIISRSRRKKITVLLAGIVLFAGSTSAWKKYSYPEKSWREFAALASEDLKQRLSETVYPKEIPPEENQKKIWVSPDEERFILNQRHHRQELQRLMKELAEARLQLEGWTTETSENPLRESSLEYWEKQVNTIQEQIRTIWSLLGERNLRAPPSQIPQESK